MKNVYVLHNLFTNTYSDPVFRAEDFKSLTKMQHDFILLYPDKAVEQNLHLSEIQLIGTYDEESGILDQLPVGERPFYSLKEAYDQLTALKGQLSNGNSAN